MWHTTRGTRHTKPLTLARLVLWHATHCQIRLANIRLYAARSGTKKRSRATLGQSTALYLSQGSIAQGRLCRQILESGR